MYIVFEGKNSVRRPRTCIEKAMTLFVLYVPGIVTKKSVFKFRDEKLIDFEYMIIRVK